jgi:23S rRNA G2445 N2-methylase RlmL
MPSRHQKARVVTSLRPSVAYSMLRSIAFAPFEIIADPLCGCGTIPLEASSLSSWTHCIGGDASLDAVGKAAQNAKGTRVDILSWDVTRLPLRSKGLILTCGRSVTLLTAGCLDVIVSDLPFGNLCGSRRVNKQKLPQSLFSHFFFPRSTIRRCILEHLRNSIAFFG